MNNSALKNLLNQTMESHEEIISRLKFIGHIQKDEKINVTTVCRQPNSLATRISRTILYPDNRSNAYKFVKDVVTRSFEILEGYIHKENYLVGKSIITDLIKAKQGLQNIRGTYASDTKFCCDIDVLQEEIDVKLLELKKEHENLFGEQTEDEN